MKLRIYRLSEKLEVELHTREDFLEWEVEESQKEAYQPFLRTYLETAEDCLSIGAGMGVNERRWIEPFRNSRRRLLLTDVDAGGLEAVKRLWGAETMHVDALDMPSSLIGGFDVVYALGVEYNFDDAEYVTFASNLRRCLKAERPECRVLLVVLNLRASTVLNPFRVLYRMLDLDRRLPTNILALLGRRHDLTVFWGWQRTLGEHRRLLRKAGLEITEVIPLFDDGSIWRRLSGIWASKMLGIVAVPDMARNTSDR